MRAERAKPRSARWGAVSEPWRRHSSLSSEATLVHLPHFADLLFRDRFAPFSRPRRRTTPVRNGPGTSMRRAALRVDRAAALPPSGRSQTYYVSLGAFRTAGGSSIRIAAELSGARAPRGCSEPQSPHHLSWQESRATGRHCNRGRLWVGGAGQEARSAWVTSTDLPARRWFLDNVPLPRLGSSRRPSLQALASLRTCRAGRHDRSNARPAQAIGKGRAAPGARK